MKRPLALASLLFALTIPACAADLHCKAQPAYVWRTADGVKHTGFYGEIPEELVLPDPDFHDAGMPYSILEPVAFTELRPIIEPSKIKGLIRVEKKPRIFVYLTESGEEVSYPTQLKGAKDLRKYEEAHPQRAAFQAWVKRWEGTIGLSWLGITAVQAVRKGFF